MTKITIGADPEVFYSNDDEFVSAIGLIGGSKEEPRKEQDGFFTLEDNVTAEFNIPPATSFKNFNLYVQQGIENVRKYASSNNLFISNAASAVFSEKQLDNPIAKMFGCEPDFNAWLGCPNNPPQAENSQMRSCGGHVHVGGVEKLSPYQVIRAMDLFLGVPSVILDSDKNRRELYGKAGSFRFKPYGVEYRTLSNFWIFNSTLRRWVWFATQQAVKFITDGNTISEDSAIGQLIQHTINESDPDGYYALVEEYPLIKIDHINSR